MASVRAFQGRLNVTRRATYEMFGDIRDDAFVPGYLPLEGRRGGRKSLTRGTP